MTDPIYYERTPDLPDKQQRLSYKFQRLRERLREAIQTGVLSGKLPGERVLARQFRVNAKTLSKALTDLAAEGLLDRTVGRGTYVRGQMAEEEPSLGRWLILADADQEYGPVVRQFKAMNPETQVVTDSSTLRPSFLTAFSAVINLAAGTSELTLRDLLLRSLRVVLVDSLPRNYAATAVLIDRLFCSSRLLRMLSTEHAGGLALVDTSGDDTLLPSLRQQAASLSEGLDVTPCAVGDAVAAYRTGCRGFICTSYESAAPVVASLRAAGVGVPRQASVAAMGIEPPDEARVSGFAVSAEQLVRSVRQFLVEPGNHRHAPLWLVGAFVDHGTMKTAPVTMKTAPAR